MGKKPKYARVGGGSYGFYRERKPKNENGWVWFVVGVVGFILLVTACS